MIRQVIPANQLHGIIDNLGIPYSGINTSYNNTGTMSPADGDILVSLNENHDPTDKFVQVIRTRMHHDFPDVGVWFPPADIVAQVLNFGLSAPIDIQITGEDKAANFAFASTLMDQIRHIPGAVDFRIQEHHRSPLRSGRDCLDALHHGHHLECAGLDGCDHVYGSSDGEQRFGSHFRQ